MGMLKTPHALSGLFAALFIACLCVGCSRQPPAGPATQTINESNDGGTIDLEVGDHLIVRLAGNPTTGYTWEREATPMPSLILTSEKQYTPDASDTVGGGGYYQWAFQAEKVGTTNLKLIYQRPFEPDQTPAKTFVVAVQVF